MANVALENWMTVKRGGTSTTAQERPNSLVSYDGLERVETTGVIFYLFYFF